MELRNRTIERLAFGIVVALLAGAPAAMARLAVVATGKEHVTIVDLSQPIYKGMPVYPGHLATVVFDYHTHAETLGKFESDLSYATKGLILSDHGRFSGMGAGDTMEIFFERLNAGDIDGIAELYEDDAVVVDGDGAPVGPIRDGDSVIFFNFRADRARQLTRALALDTFDEFERTARPHAPRARRTALDEHDRTSVAAAGGYPRGTGVPR